MSSREPPGTDDTTPPPPQGQLLRALSGEVEGPVKALLRHLVRRDIRALSLRSRVPPIPSPPPSGLRLLELPS